MKTFQTKSQRTKGNNHEVAGRENGEIYPYLLILIHFRRTLRERGGYGERRKRRKPNG
jgi:hypothetical protein